MNPLEITLPINALLMMIIPIILAIVLTRRFKSGWRLIWIGAATFIISQIGHIPFNILLTELFKRGILPSPPENYALVFNAIVLGLSAGLWEELTRWGVYKWWAKDARTWRKGVLLGTGHGGVEAFLLGLLALYTFAQLLILRQVDISTVVPQEQLEIVRQQVQAYWSTPVYLSLLGALERSFTLVIQIALSVIVLQTFTRRQSRWLWLAIGLHAAVDAVSVYVISTWGAIAAEVTVAIFMFICLVLIFLLRQPETEHTDPGTAEELSQPDNIQIEPPQESAENLEKTRYN